MTPATIEDAQEFGFDNEFAVSFRESSGSSRPAGCSIIGTSIAQQNSMTDVALSILALIAGGLTLELFGAAIPVAGEHKQQRTVPPGIDAFEAIEDSSTGNPS